MGVDLIDQELYDEGYAIGQRMRNDIGLTREEKSDVCVQTADALTREFGWNDDDRFAWVYGCQEGWKGKPESR